MGMATISAASARIKIVQESISGLLGAKIESAAKKTAGQVFIFDKYTCFSIRSIFFSASYLFLSFVLHDGRTLIRRITNAELQTDFL